MLHRPAQIFEAGVIRGNIVHSVGGGGGRSRREEGPLAYTSSIHTSSLAGVSLTHRNIGRCAVEFVYLLQRRVFGDKGLCKGEEEVGKEWTVKICDSAEHQCGLSVGCSFYVGYWDGWGDWHVMYLLLMLTALLFINSVVGVNNENN